MLVKVDSFYFTCNLYIYIYTNVYMKITKIKRILKKLLIVLKNILKT